MISKKIRKEMNHVENQIDSIISTFEKDTNIRVLSVSRKDEKTTIGCFIDMDIVNL